MWRIQNHQLNEPFTQTFLIDSGIYKICEERVADTQFGFVKGKGTRDILSQRCRDVNCDIYTCFVNYQKTFDRIQHPKMIQVLKRTGMDNKDLRIIQNVLGSDIHYKKSTLKM